MRHMTISFALRRGHHAINQFGASLNFFQPVSASLFATLLARVQEIARREDLPAPVNRQMIQFNVGLGTPIPSQVSSIGFQRFLPNGETDLALIVDNMSITVESNNYQGWEKISSFLLSVFNEIGLIFLTEMPLVRSIGIQYQNEFRAISSQIRSANEIFNSRSPWIAPFYLSSEDIWHCHVGVFQPTSENSRDLIQVNTDNVYQKVAPLNEDMLYSRVLVAVSSNYDIPGKSPLMVEPDVLESRIGVDLNRLHGLAKDIVRATFADEYIRLMNVG